MLLRNRSVVVWNITSVVRVVLRAARQRSKFVGICELTRQLCTPLRLWPQRVHCGHKLDEVLEQPGTFICAAMGCEGTSRCL